MKRAAKNTMLVSLAVLSGVGGIALAKAPDAPVATVTAQRQATFAIKNMTCALCPVTVRKAMEGVSGVKSVAVDFGAKTATVTFDPSKTTVAAIAQASANAGYPARPQKGLTR